MTGRAAHPLLDETVADADLRQAVALIATLADRPAPTPTAALADVLERGLQPTVVPFRRPAAHRGRWAARTGAGLVAAAASVVVAGTAAALPAPVQEVVADLVSALTPFDLPRPGAPDRTPPPAPDDDATPSPATSDVPSPTAPAARTSTEERGSRPVTGHQTAESPPAEEAADDAADASEDAAEDAREREEAAADAARERDEAARDAARETAEAAEPAEDEREDEREDDAATDD